MRDVEEPGLRARVEVLVEDAGGILQRHLILGEGHHLGAKGEMERVERCPLEWRGSGSKGHDTSGQSGRRSVRPLPPLSWTLRDSPEPWPGLTPSVSGRSPAALQSALPPAVLLPESFRGGCSFGAAPTRDLSCGRAYSTFCLAPTGAEGQPVAVTVLLFRRGSSPSEQGEKPIRPSESAVSRPIFV